MRKTTEQCPSGNDRFPFPNGSIRDFLQGSAEDKRHGPSFRLREKPLRSIFAFRPASTAIIRVWLCKVLRMLPSKSDGNNYLPFSVTGQTSGRE